MLRITADSFHEKLTAGNNDIILNGTPNNLRGKIFISNKNEDILRVKSLPLKHGAKLGKAMNTNQAILVSCKLNPGEEKLVDIFHSIHPNTAPGTYESIMQVGGEKRQVKMVVQQNIDIDIQPKNFTFIGTEPGIKHIAEITVTNLGNVAFTVPDIKHVATLDMDMFCRAFGMGIRNDKSTGYESLLNEISKNIQTNLPDWARANVAECGTTLTPGETQLIHVSIKMPKNCDSQKDYNGNMRFWNKDISYTIKSSHIK